MGPTGRTVDPGLGGSRQNGDRQAIREAAWARKYRLNNFLEFLGPGGFATPDDAEALEHCQRGFKNSKEALWNDISKGMGKEKPSYDDELQMRAFWTQWNRQMFETPVPGIKGAAA